MKAITQTEFLARQAKDLKNWKRGEKVREALPERFRAEAGIYVHRDHVAVTLWDELHPKAKLVLAANIVQEMGRHIIEAEHWKAGCVSTQPAAINSYAKGGNAEKIGTHMVEITSEGGEGFGPNIAVKIWVRFGGEIAQVKIPIGDMNKLRAGRVPARYDIHGTVIEWKMAFGSHGEDQLRTWGDRSLSHYSGSYYWRSVKGFREWAAKESKSAPKGA